MHELIQDVLIKMTHWGIQPKQTTLFQLASHKLTKTNPLSWFQDTVCTPNEAKYTI